MRHFLLCLCLLSCSALLQAEVYKWVDADGTTHFGDRKPASGKSQQLQFPEPVASESSSTASSAEPQEDYRVRQQKLLNAISEERAQKEAEARKKAEQLAKRQQDCAMYKDYLRNISSGVIYSLNDKGERIYASDAEQTKEINNTKALIRQQCQ